MPGDRVLIVEDTQEIADVVVAVLEGAGHEVRVVTTGRDALGAASTWSPAVVLLDLGLPDMDGVEVCRALRGSSDAYILMLTARDDEIDRVVGLTVGADDYVTKPFSPRELAARVSALLRRPRTTTAAPASVAAPEPTGRRLGSLVVDPESREVRVSGQLVDMTRTEFDLLDAFTEAPRRVHSRGQLRERVWGGGWFGDDHAVDVHVSNLRRKLSDAGAPNVIATVRGVGYRLSPALLADRRR